MYFYSKFCTYKIVSQNTLHKVNLMRSLMEVDIAGVIRPQQADI